MSFPRAELNSLIRAAGGPIWQDRLWPNRFPQKGAAMPRGLWSRTNTIHNPTLDGRSTFGISDVEITCEAETEEIADKLAEMVKENLDGMIGNAVQGIMFAESNDDPEPPQDGAEAGLSRVRLRATVHHAE